MNRNILIAAIVVILLILAAVGFMAFGNKSSNEITALPKQQTSEISQPTVAGAKSMRDLLAGGQAQTCTFADAATSGTMYVGGGKMRGDFTSSSNGVASGSHVISDGQTMYMWMDNQQTGYKMAFDPSQAQATGGATKPNDSFDPDKKVEYDCSSWSIDSSKFTPPGNVTFTEFGAMTIPTGATTNDSVTPPSNDAKAQQCAACNSLTGDAQTQCKTALKCN